MARAWAVRRYREQDLQVIRCLATAPPWPP